ncbi:MAG: SUMF1/EgtB/PvdO family nonheme iron enzyme [Alphaproteobacteria bacterium]|jgi:formylglycine-generating enzyme required for sulfatase activity|nr:SUMF1/EgtB/PvdO family nonheme iron enzyme [Alphaproteobacteria bacterium]
MMTHRPTAFLSYARADDEYSGGKISRFRERLAETFRVVTGRPIGIFQDRTDIAWGEHWPSRLEQALAETKLLIPVLSPGFFASRACRDELQTFLRHEAQLGRQDLILPVYWIDCPELADPERRRQDDLAAAVHGRQHADWRKLAGGTLTARKATASLQDMARRLNKTLETGAPLTRAGPDLQALLAALDCFVDRAETLSRDRALNSLTDQKLSHIRAIQEVIAAWIHAPDRAGLLEEFVDAQIALRDFEQEARDFNYLNRFDLVSFETLLQGMQRVTARDPAPAEEAVALDWENDEDPGAVRLRKLRDEAARLQAEELPKARDFLSDRDLSRLETGLAGIKLQCSAPKFRPMRLSEKRPLIEDYKTRLNACVLLLQQQDLALAPYVRWLRPPAVFRDHPDAPEMVPLPAGQFMMGSEEYDDEKPPHKVTIGNRFAVGRYPVTFAEYDRFVAATGANAPNDEGWGRERRPVITVSWEDAQAYVAWLSRETGKPYRLLSEAEWEYACRAGTTTTYSWTDDITPERANYNDSGHDKTMPVGSYPANPWGLYDMHGNVWEWVEDRWHDSYEGAPDDGSAWTTGDSGARVLRGGSWVNNPEYLRSAIRSRDAPGVRNLDAGFRVARTLTP